MTDPEFVLRLQAVLAAEAGLKNVRELLAHDKEIYKCKFRDTAVFLARKHTELGWEQLAAMFGARHHTTLIGSYRRETLRLQRNPPRRDKRKWQEWHDYVLAKAREPEKGNENA